METLNDGFASFDFGKHAVHSQRRVNRVEVKLRVRDGKVSFTGAVWNAPQTDWVSGGQNHEELNKVLKHNKLWQKIHKLWLETHLNDMHAGTREQEQALSEYYGDSRHWDYTESCDYLKSIGLYEHNGYRYGTKWLTWELTPEQVTGLNELLEIGK